MPSPAAISVGVLKTLTLLIATFRPFLCIRSEAGASGALFIACSAIGTITPGESAISHCASASSKSITLAWHQRQSGADIIGPLRSVFHLPLSAGGAPPCSRSHHAHSVML